MNELKLVPQTQQIIPVSQEEFTEYVDITEEIPFWTYTPLISKTRGQHFIKANTTQVNIHHLRHECIVPVFTKDNELTLSHPEFIETAYEAARKFFPNEQLDAPEIMVSHIVKGRAPGAITKPKQDLLQEDITIYYERMAFSFEIPTISTTIAGNRVNLCFTGVRAYNRENLFNNKSPQRFSVAIGFQNTVCCNLCTFTDGYKSDLRVMNGRDLFIGIIDLLTNYDANKHLRFMNEFQRYSLTEHQFAQFLGKSRLYQYLPAKEKKILPLLDITDTQINAIAKNYYTDKNFACDRNESRISMWNVYNLFTEANKSSYIDNFLDRSMNATELAGGLTKAIRGDKDYEWFIS